VAETQAVYYRAKDGSEPVNDYIDALDARRQAAIDFPENRASIAILRHAGFARRSGTGVLLEFELAVTPPARSTAIAARRENP
jgi:hypothetical protein